MAQSTILAAGTTVATSSSVTVPAGGVVTLGIFVASGAIPPDASFLVSVTTPGAVLPIGSLNNMNPTMVIPGPCAVTVTRNSAGGAGTSVGVFAESGDGLQVAGTVASGSTDSGGPVKVGTLVQSTPALLTDAQRANMLSGVRGSLFVDLFSNGDNARSSILPLNVDAATGNVNGLATQARGLGWNGASWDRLRGDTVAQSVLPGLSSTFWNYAPPTAGITSSTAGVTAKTAAGASVRNYISGGTLSWNTLSAATEFVIRDGAAGTVIWRATIGTVAGVLPIILPVPLRGTANTLVEIAAITSVTGNIHCTLQGFTGA